MINKIKKPSILTCIILAVVYSTLALLVSTGTVNKYYSGILVMVFVNIILTVSLNLASGFLGQLVLGHAGFMSVGAYASALFTLNSGLPISIAFPLSIIIAGIAASLFGVLIGIPALRLRGDYLAIITLGFGEIIKVLINFFDFTGGARGLRGIPRIVDKSSNVNLELVKISYAFFLAVLTVYVISSFIRSRHGRAVISIREDEIASESSGVKTTHYKLLAFVMAAFFAGIAGAIYAHHLGVLNPSKFSFNYSVEILVMVVLGGMGSITGSIVSATALTLLPEMLRGFSDYRMLVYSVILIIVMLFKPTGLMGGYEFSLTRLLKSKKKTPTTKKEGDE